MSKSALLVMDIQQGIVSRFTEGFPDYLPRLGQAIATARSARLPVIYVVVGFRAGYPEVSSRNRGFGAITDSGGMLIGERDTEIHPDITPQGSDIVVTKRRVSAFAGSDLDVVLRASDIDTLVLSGIATSGVVLSTLRQAADLDYRITVLSDGCLDGDEEVHRVLTTKVFPRQAEVCRIENWIP
ncbi:cysteine hydrolase family protein [Sciscionella marina]|uniref:cysteine hydrolase family protein n=1 Tax=Sciscionella marina TaxID=508770 RepID=UPI000371A002|nr:isochorismatase family cysteine hydrolase [Sciscionella marina]